jgi:hypothetical protein
MECGFVPTDWAELNFGACVFGDKRRTVRGVLVVSRMVCKSSSSLPKQMDTSAELKAAYRLLSSDSVTHEAVTLPHRTRTRELAEAPGQGTVLFVQDKTELDYTTHRHATGLGYIGNGGGYGFEAQSCLAVLPGSSPRILGMACQGVWTRPERSRVKNETLDEREARWTEDDAWGDVLESIGPAPDGLTGTQWVSVGDRGSDVFSYMVRARDLGWDCVIRSEYNRRLDGESIQAPRLQNLARCLPKMADSQLHLRARPGAAARNVELRLAWTKATIRPPDGQLGEPVSVWVVRVWEEAPKGLEWILLSTVPVESAEQARQIAEWYRHRWLIEEYHKCLKTGCSIEARQLDTAEGLLALLGFLSVIAVLLLSLKETPEKAEVPLEASRVLAAIRGLDHQDWDPPKFLRELAKLGGFLGRKGDGKPGWQTIWAGWTRLQDIMLGFELAGRLRCG